MIKFHSNCRRKPKFKMRRFMPYVEISVPFAANNLVLFDSDVLLLHKIFGGIADISAPESTKKRWFELLSET